MMGLTTVAVLCLLVANSCHGYEFDFALNTNDNVRYSDCDDVVRKGHYIHEGVYPIYLNDTYPLNVTCRYDPEMNATFAVIMQQKYGHIDFKRSWRDYENGFGSSGDFWIGLSRIQRLTRSGYRVLRITLQDWGHTIKTLQYNHFYLGTAFDRYTLHISGYISSHVLPDDFSHNNGRPFATMDRPDIHNCAGKQKAGWWYNYCTYTLPTGRYYQGGYYKPTSSFYDGIYYKDWHGYDYSLKYIKMELRTP